jgi:uncharacterized protein
MLVNKFCTTYGHQQHVSRALNLLLEDNTIPFVARYRQSEIGHAHADDLTKWLKNYHLYEDLQKKITLAISTLKRRNLLTSTLRQQFLACTTIQQLDDLWLPFKKTTSTRAQKALDSGLGSLAESIYSGQCNDQQFMAQQQNALRSNPNIQS